MWSIPALLSRTRGGILLRPPSRSLDGSRTSPVISKKLDRTVCSGAADPGFDRQVDDGQATVRLDRAAGKEPLHRIAQRLLGRLADGHGHDAAPALSGAISLRLRSLSRCKASRWKRGRRLSRSSVSASAIEASQIGKCRVVMQEFGHRSGAHRDRAGAVRSFTLIRSRHSAVAGSKKQSFRWPTCSVRARCASIARTRPVSAIRPGNGSSFVPHGHTRWQGGRRGTGQPFAAPVSLVLRDDIVELAERAFLLNFLRKPEAEEPA